MAAKQILFLVGDFVEDYEVMVPFQMLQMVGHHCSAVCPGKRAGESVATAIHDFEGAQTYSEKRGHNFVLNADFDSLSLAQFDALVIPGGRAPEYLRLDPQVLALVQHFAHANKPIAAICHGPQLLISADVIRGRKLTAVKPIVVDVKNAGGEFYDQEVVVDNEQLVTSRTPDDLPAFNREALRLLGAGITPPV